MIATWMMYHIAIVGLLVLAAMLLEEIAHRYHAASRWIWVGALVSSVAVPSALLMFRRLTPDGSAIGSVALGRITVMSDAADGSGIVNSLQEIGGLGLDDLNVLLLVLWATASALLLGYFGVSALRLGRVRHGWTRAKVLGQEVLLAEGAGPAVVGLREPEIVIPRWALQLPEDEQRMMLAHEREHVVSGDTRLLLAGYAAVVALPWNMPVWLIARRLRDAIEFDCDRRVLRETGDVAAYGMLLLAVGGRPAALPVGVAAFSRGRTQLERRVRIMTRLASQHRTGMAIVAALVAISLVMVACSVEPPAQTAEAIEETGTPPEPEPNTGSTIDELPVRLLTVDPPETAAESEPVRPPEASRENTPTLTFTGDEPGATVSLAISRSGVAPEEPAFVPMEVRPRLRNATVLAQTLQRNYPGMLKDAGVEGTSTLWVRIDTEGRVEDVRVFESSGYPQFDQVAINTMRETADFSPAQNKGAAVSVWIQIPVVFQTAR